MSKKKIINFAVGPVMMQSDILKIGLEQVPYFRTDDFSNLSLNNEEMLLNLIGAPKDSRAIFLTGSGTAAMEASVMNILNKNDKVLVVNGGSFGARFKQICDIHGLNIDEIKLSHFEQLSQGTLDQYNGKGYTALLINVHETSTGVLYDMKLVSEFCKRNNILLIVDAISSFLADHYNMSAYGANATILSSQKAIALPPGMSYIIVDQLAQERINKNRISSLYFDLKRYLDDGERGQTPFTPAVSNLIQLNKRLKNIVEYGINNVIADVLELAKDFRAKIVNLPLKIAHNLLSNALTPIIPQGKANAKEIFETLKNDYGIFVVPSGGDLEQTLFRVGHIGALSIDDNKTLINALNDMKENNKL